MNPACCLDSCLSDQTFRSRHVLHVLAVGPHKQDWRSVAESATANSSVREERRGTEPRVVHQREQRTVGLSPVDAVVESPPEFNKYRHILRQQHRRQSSCQPATRSRREKREEDRFIWNLKGAHLAYEQRTRQCLARREQRQILSNRQTPIRDYNFWTN